MKPMELKPVPSREWQAEWDRLMLDPWLVKKTDRNRRMAEHLAYAMKFLPELKGEPGLVIDLGPGCGELLEIAEHYGHTAIGVDAPAGAGGMGDPYITACRMIHQRQGLLVKYERALSWLARNRYPGQAVAISMRGSLEQIASDFMDGQPHHEHMDCRLMSWRENEATEAALSSAIHSMARMLTPTGVIAIHANGAKNHAWAAGALIREGVRAGLTYSQPIQDERAFKFAKEPT